MNNYYQESGKANPIGLLITFLVLLTVAIVFGYLYSMLTVYIILPYFNFFLTVGFGLLLAFTLRLITHFTKNRNKTSRYVLAALGGLMGILFSWVAYILYTYIGNFPSMVDYIKNIPNIINPKIFQGINYISQQGYWSIGEIVPSSRQLWGIWFIEAVIILFPSLFFTFRGKKHPFSEIHNKWFKKHTLDRYFEPFYSSQKIEQSLDIDPLQTMEDLGKGDAFKHSKVHLYYLEEAEEAFVNIDLVQENRDGKGKPQVEVILEPYKIKQSVAKEILSKYHHTKPWLDFV